MHDDSLAEKDLTVAQLIALLQKVQGDAKVSLEGCDCIGGCCGVELKGDGKVQLQRTDQHFEIQYSDGPEWQEEIVSYGTSLGADEVKGLNVGPSDEASKGHAERVAEASARVREAHADGFRRLARE